MNSAMMARARIELIMNRAFFMDCCISIYSGDASIVTRLIGERWFRPPHRVWPRCLSMDAPHSIGDEVQYLPASWIPLMDELTS